MQDWFTYKAGLRPGVWVLAGALTLVSSAWGLPNTGSALAAQGKQSIDAALVNVSADHQTYDGQKSKTFLKGNVDVTYKDVRIKSKEGTLDMDPITGAPMVASFFPRPTARRIIPKQGEDTLNGDIIRIHINENAISAEGNTVTYVTTVAADPFTIRADTQQFDNVTKNVVARGQVQVNYKDTKAASPRAILQVGPNGKAEKVVFSGGAQVEKENSIINGERVTIMVNSGNLIAEQNVKTSVDLKDPKGGSTKVLINSDYQQYDKASETFLASGNVKIVYDTYVAVGPKATFKIKEGTVEKIFLTGRSSITENDRKIVADKITITTNPKHFDAFGNVKTQFQAQNNGAAAEEPVPPGNKGAAKGSKPAAGAKGAKAPAAKPKPKSTLPQPEPDLIEE